MENPNYAGAPPDGSAWTTGGDCLRRVVRGGSWLSGIECLRSAWRNGISDSTYGLPSSAKHGSIRRASPAGGRGYPYGNRSGRFRPPQSTATRRR